MIVGKPMLFSNAKRDKCKKGIEVYKSASRNLMNLGLTQYKLSCSKPIVGVTTSDWNTITTVTDESTKIEV